MPMVGSEPEAVDEEYEYQYDETETETFLVDLDLTSLNGPLAATTESRDAEAGKGHGKEEEGGGGGGRVEIVELASENPLVRYKGQMYSCSWVDMIGTSMFFTRPAGGGDNNAPEGAAAAAVVPAPAPATATVVRSDADFVLLDTSHIKLAGQQGSLVPRGRGLKRRNPSAEEEGEEKERQELNTRGEEGGVVGGGEMAAIGQEQDDDDDDTNNDQANDAIDDEGKPIVNGSALPGFSSTNWRTNIARRRQADFLDRLMQTKRRRGETDIVPTVGDRKGKEGKATYQLDGQAWAGLTDEQRVKLSNLSGRVVKGDARAVAALREMYATLPGAVLPSGEGD